MAGQRDRIRMSSEEVASFLAEELLLTAASNGPDGWPHLAPLNYVVADGAVCAWTYAASQKVRNLERDPRATYSVEAGEAYDELRGVVAKCRVQIVRDADEVEAFGRSLAARRLNIHVDSLDDSVGERVAAQAGKRVILRFHEHDLASWDHRKLAG